MKINVKHRRAHIAITADSGIQTPPFNRELLLRLNNLSSFSLLPTRTQTHSPTHIYSGRYEITHHRTNKEANIVIKLLAVSLKCLEYGQFYGFHTAAAVAAPGTGDSKGNPEHINHQIVEHIPECFNDKRCELINFYFHSFGHTGIVMYCGVVEIDTNILRFVGNLCVCVCVFV